MQLLFIIIITVVAILDYYCCSNSLVTMRARDKALLYFSQYRQLTAHHDYLVDAYIRGMYEL